MPKATSSTMNLSDIRLQGLPAQAEILSAT
jgi:hypothetical protein